MRAMSGIIVGPTCEQASPTSFALSFPFLYKFVKTAPSLDFPATLVFVLVMPKESRMPCGLGGPHAGDMFASGSARLRKTHTTEKHVCKCGCCGHRRPDKNACPPISHPRKEPCTKLSGAMSAQAKLRFRMKEVEGACLHRWLPSRCLGGGLAPTVWLLHVEAKP